MPEEKFLSYLKYEKRFSPHTLIAYQTDLRQFSEFLLITYQQEDITAANHQLIRSWVVSLMEQQLSPVSVRRKITTLNTFFKFLIREGIAKENPMKKVIAPKASKKLPVFVEQHSMELLLDEIDFGEGFVAARDRLILELFYSTGIRQAELINLKENDLDYANCTLKVLGKRNKERIIPFGKHLKNLLNINQKEKGESGLSSKYVFVTEKGKKLYGKLVYRIVNHYLGKVTTIDKKSPHVLRHTFATHMLNNGADLNSIKELLGHVNLSATEIYTHITFEKLKTIYKQAHPRA